MEKNGFSGKNHHPIKLYLSRLKSHAQVHSPMLRSTTQHLFSSCKYPRTPSFSGSPPPPRQDKAATLSDVEAFLFENFRSLYVDKRTDNSSPSPTEASTASSTTSSGSATSSSSAAVGDSDGGTVAVVTLTRDPYRDLRRSMQEAVEGMHGRGQQKAPLDWEFMQEMLFCYLDLNERGVHRFVLEAFTDVMAGLRRTGRRSPAGEGADVGGGCGGRRRKVREVEEV